MRAAYCAAAKRDIGGRGPHMPTNEPPVVPFYRVSQSLYCVTHKICHGVAATRSQQALVVTIKAHS